MVTVVVVPGHVEDLVHHRVDRREQRLQDEVDDRGGEAHVGPPTPLPVELVPDHLLAVDVAGKFLMAVLHSEKHPRVREELGVREEAPDAAPLREQELNFTQGATVLQQLYGQGLALPHNLVITLPQESEFFFRFLSIRQGFGLSISQDIIQWFHVD